MIIFYPMGSRAYFNSNGERHNENGPALIDTSGNKFWFINGNIHRLDGPAIEYKYGVKYWHYNGHRIPVNSQIEFEKYIKLLVFI